MALLIPLIIYADRIKLVLAVNSYLNVMSVAVSSIVLLYATISEARQKQIAELQEKRATEDHTHVTEMHALIMQTLENQNKEMDELKRVLSSLAGKEVQTVERIALPDVRSLHPRGQERFSETDSSQRMEETLHQNALVTTLRKRLIAAADDDVEDDDSIRRPTPDEVNGKK
jgi:DNA primase catalytic subunit